MMDEIPTLATKRLKLRPFQLADAEEVTRYASEKLIAANTLSIPHPYSRKMAVEWIQTHAKSFSEGTGVNFAIELRQSGELLGAIGLGIQLEHDHAEMGYWIGKPHWSQGFASEAAQAVVRFGFNRWELERIFAQHFAGNPASGKVMINCGMQYEGCLRHHVKKWGEYQDLKVYGILRHEWRQLN